MPLKRHSLCVPRFLEALTDKRREQAESLAELALKEAKARQEEEKMNAALAEAKKAAAAKSVPSTPATTPMQPQKGLLEGRGIEFHVPHLMNRIFHALGLSI
jgi:hypothetical protein